MKKRSARTGHIFLLLLLSFLCRWIWSQSLAVSKANLTVVPISELYPQGIYCREGMLMTSLTSLAAAHHLG